MKKVLYTLLVMLLLAGTLAACVEAPEQEETAPPAEAEIPAAEEVPEADPSTEAETEEAETSSDPQSEVEEEITAPAAFRLQQIEEALTPQLDFGGERLLDWEVVSAERVGVNPAGTMVFFEPAGQYIDISDSVRYSVTVRWADEPNYPGYFWDDDPRLGTTETRYWDFFTVDGKPELVFVVC